MASPSASLVPSKSRNATKKVSPDTNDILLGRGLPFQAHPGNLLMHQLIKEQRERYKNLPRYRRGEVVNDILELLRNKGCRFLVQRGSSSGRNGNLSLTEDWEIATQAEAYHKVCHALRCKKSQRKSASQGESKVLTITQSESLEGSAAASVTGIIASSAPVESSQAASSPQLPFGHSTAAGRREEDTGHDAGMPRSEDDLDTKLAIQMAIENYLKRKQNDS